MVNLAGLVSGLYNKYIFTVEVQGKNGKGFTMRKIRTMNKNHPLPADEIIRQCGIGRYGKIENDPRVTPLGKIVRPMFIDHIPQLYNVLMRHMGLYGLSPLYGGYEELVPDDLKKERMRRRPGLIPGQYLYPCVDPPDDMPEEGKSEYWKDWRIKAERWFVNYREEHPYKAAFKCLVVLPTRIITRKLRGV